MDLNTSDSSPVLTESASLTSTRIGSSSSMKSYSAAAQAYSTKLYSVIPRMKPVLSKLDCVCANTWLDAMRSSSPPRNDESDLEYRIWTKKYPSALTSFEEIVGSPKCKIALFLDYDGTLSPIVDDPDFAVMSNTMRAALRTASKCFPTAIISGRSREKVYKFVKLKEVYYAGSHGMDILCPVRENDYIDGQPSSIISTAKKVHLLQPAQEFLPVIKEVFRSLLDITKDIIGAKVEYNKFCLSVHYRLIDEEVWPEVAQRVLNLLKDYPRLRVTHGRKVLEIRPMINWNKGKAVEFLLESLGLRNCDDVLSVYVGDDKTDEDAFKVLRECKLGYGILVSSAPKETGAFYSLRDPTEVMEFLRSLVRWKNSMATHEGVYCKRIFTPTQD